MQLTERDITFLSMVAKGGTNKQIAFCCSVEEKTVKNRLTLIYRQLGAKGRTQAVVKAIRDGSLDISKIKNPRRVKCL